VFGAVQIRTVDEVVEDFTFKPETVPGRVAKVVTFSEVLAFEWPTLFTAFTLTEYLTAGFKPEILKLVALVASCSTGAHLKPPPLISTT
jgi:hypothetical protein